MADARWARIEQLFDGARALPPAERAAFLDAGSAGDAALRAELDALLAAHDDLATRDAAFLDRLDPVRAAAILDAAAREPEAVGRYHVVRRLGRGGMGVVYLARDPVLDRPVAVKLLPPELTADERASRRFMEEARAASALDHPNIGTVYEVGRTDDERPFIAMAYYDGETVRGRIARGPVPVAEAVAIGAQVADGLAAAHAAGIVHRDIKPENLIVTPEGRLRVLDFGVARTGAAALTRTGGTVGTVAYMSPEQTRGAEVDHRADVWALGVVLYELLTGARPFRGDATEAVVYAIRNDAPEPVRSQRPDAPPALAATVERCLEKQPDGRFASAAELAAALRAAAPAAGEDAAVAPDGAARRRDGWRAWLPAAAYPLAAWPAHRAAAALTHAAGLPGWVPGVLLILLVLGFALVVATTLARHAAPASLRGRLTWPRAAAAGGAALALLAAAAGAHVALRALGIGPLATLASRGLIDERDPIVLADFAADAADPRIGRVVTEALRIDLLRSPTLRLAGPGEVAAALRRMGRDPAAGVPEDVARELALREGQKAVIAGEVGALGGGYVLAVRVVAAGDGATLVAVRETARDSSGLIDAVDRLSKRLRERIGESLRALHAAEPLPRVATASLPALRRYADAQALAWVGGDDARIASLLEEAVALDSAFAAAHRSLAVTYWNMRADRGRTVAATQAAYALRDRLPDRERFLIEATYHWQVLGDPRLAAEAYRRVLALDPDDAVARNNLGLALLFEGEPAEAERVLRARLAPDAPARLRINIARALYFQGRTQAALAVIDSLAADTEESAIVELSRVRFLGGDGRWSEAEAAAHAVHEHFGASPQVRAEALRALWHLALTRGRLREAERYFTEIEASLERVGALDALARAAVQRADARRTLLGDADGALAVLDSLLSRPGLDVLSVGATVAPRVAAALAAAGDTARAARLVEAWNALPAEARGDPDTFSPELALAHIDLAAGRPGAAVERLRRASAGDIQAINYLPALGRAYREAAAPDSAIAVFERYLGFRHVRRMHRVPGHLGPVLIEVAELYELAGDSARARTAHARLAELWRDADPELKPHVAHHPLGAPL